jgi:hypothetical protein
MRRSKDEQTPVLFEDTQTTLLTDGSARPAENENVFIPIDVPISSILERFQSAISSRKKPLFFSE